MSDGGEPRSGSKRGAPCPKPGTFGRSSRGKLASSTEAHQLVDSSCDLRRANLDVAESSPSDEREELSPDELLSTLKQWTLDRWLRSKYVDFTWIR